MNYYVTGNEYISLPTIREMDGALEGLSFLHMGAKGMIELCGREEAPFIAPFLEVNHKPVPLTGLQWCRIHHWIPVFTAAAGTMEIEGVILTPIGERGFGYRLRVHNHGADAHIRLGLRGTWAETKHSINESKVIRVEKNLYTFITEDYKKAYIRKQYAIDFFSDMYEDDLNDMEDTEE